MSETCLTLAHCLLVVCEWTVLRQTLGNTPPTAVSVCHLDYSLWRIVGWDVCTFERVMRKAEANDSKHLLLGGQELMHTILKQLFQTTMSQFNDRREKCPVRIPQVLLAMLEERLRSRNGLLEICRMMV